MKTTSFEIDAIKFSMLIICNNKFLHCYWIKCEKNLFSVMQFNFSEINVRKKIKNFNEKFTRVTITSDSISN